MNTNEKEYIPDHEYHELRRKYGSGSIILLSVDFIELGFILAAIKLAEEHSDKIEFVEYIHPDYDKYADVLKKRIIAATGQLGLSCNEIKLLKKKFLNGLND